MFEWLEQLVLEACIFRQQHQGYHCSVKVQWGQPKEYISSMSMGAIRKVPGESCKELKEGGGLL